MTLEPSFPPMHAVTRVGRVIQQLRTFGDLHAHELELMAAELDAADAPDVAARLRLYRDVQRDEATMVVDELLDIQTDMATPPRAASMPPPPSPIASASASPDGAGGVHDPAINSPKRAKWLAEQAAEAERLKAPFSRRDFFNRAAPRSEDR
jgi:hypothetical protein